MQSELPTSQIMKLTLRTCDLARVTKLMCDKTGNFVFIFLLQIRYLAFMLQLPAIGW